MTATRYRNAWMWLAVAAMAVASLARVESSIGNGPVYTNPMLAFLAGQQNAASAVVASAPQYAHLGSTRRASAVFLHPAASGAWTAILPVLFVGLVSPLSLISSSFLLSLSRRLPAPALPSLFQRPPPALA